ncbi:hypothetical protein WA026_006228 [Henosepilachna vigintioctopunctata]|uniref:Uncharacterized protein n=1 Tax=Henosepilachna vigintioctopunctata TaxID=420089 RepID=A0AAW1TQT2_9CUCU
MTEDFIARFHNLDGILLKERKKSLFLLLNEYKTLHNEEKILQEINENLEPKTYLEEVFKLEFLLYFRRSKELLELLKKGNDIAASKIIRQPWFIESLLTDYTIQQFLQDIFPQLSVIVRSKILKQILKEKCDCDEWIDVLFDNLFEKYGIKPALILLPGCSPTKINLVLKQGIKLSKAQLKSLHENKPFLIPSYYEEYHRKGGDLEDLREFSKYLSNKNPILYIDLILKYKFNSSRLGRRTTKRYVYENRETILEEPQKYADLCILHEDALVKQLGEDFPKFLEAIMPKNLSNLKTSQAMILLNHYPKKKRYNLYQNLFWNVYKKSLILNEKFMTKKLLEVIQSDEDRERWVSKFDNKVEFIKYKPSSKAVSELKELLLICDDKDFREKLFGDIVFSCSLNNNYDELLETIKILCNRFRNTNSSVFYSFLEELNRRIDFDKFTDEFWKYIHEVILIQNKRNISIHAGTVFQYSKYLYKTKQSYEEMIPIYLKSKKVILKTLEFKIDKVRDEAFQREFLKLVLKHYSTKIRNTRTATEIVLAIKNWNKHHPHDLILVSEKQEIIDTIKKSVNVDWLQYKSDEQLCMNYLVCRENKYEEFTDIYLSHIEFLENVTMTNWYLKYRPKVFQEKIDKVAKWFDLRTRYRLMKILKKYEHTGLIEIIIKYYLEKLNDSEAEEKYRIAQLLASIMPKNSYLELLEKYVPDNDKLDLRTASAEETNLHTIQISLCQSVRFSTYKVDTLPILLKYCKGDHLQSSLCSLCSCFSRVPEKLLEETLNMLQHKAVSVRKHSIFLATQVFPTKTIQDLLQRIYVTDTNVSIRKHLFQSTYKYFLKTPLDELWNILQTHIKNITIHDNESLLLLTNIQDIPDNYKAIFFTKVVEIFDYLEFRERFAVKLYYDKLMTNIQNDSFRFLPENLCADIIKYRLFEGFKKNDSCVVFTVKFLIYGINKRENIQNVLNSFKLYKENYWQSPHGVVARSVIYSIFGDIFYTTMNTTNLRIPISKDFPTILSEEWKKLFTMQETVEEYLMLDFMILKYQNQEDHSNYAKEIVTIFNNLREEFGDSISDLFKNFLFRFLKHLLGDENYDLHLIKLLKEILQYDYSPANCILVVQLLPYYQHDSEFVKSYNEVLQKLRSGDKVVQVFLNTHFKERQYY